MISDGYSSADDEIGTGYFTYELPNGDTKSSWVSPGHNTLRGLVGTINASKGIGVTASIVNDGAGGDRPWRVVVQAKKSGADNDITFPDFYFLDGDFRFYVDDERDAQNAIIKFNGFEIMSQANKFELLPGVTLDLKDAKQDYEFTLNITEDMPKMAAKIKALVDAMNGVLEFVNKQNALDSTSDTSRTLGGDTALAHDSRALSAPALSGVQRDRRGYRRRRRLDAGFGRRHPVRENRPPHVQRRQVQEGHHRQLRPRREPFHRRAQLRRPGEVHHGRISAARHRARSRCATRAFATASRPWTTRSRTRNATSNGGSSS